MAYATVLSPEVRPARRAALSRRRARHQPVDALVDVAQALLEPHHRLAVGGEAEMPGLDDPGVHRADRNLMQVLAFDRQKGVARTLRRRGAARPERMLHIPEPEIEPGPRVGQANRLDAEEIAECTFQPDGGRVQRPNGRIVSARTFDRDHRDLTPFSTAMCTAPNCAVSKSPHRPSSVQWPAASWPMTKRQTSSLTTTRGQGAVRCDPPAFDRVDECRHRSYPNSFATFWNQATKAGGM